MYWTWFLGGWSIPIIILFIGVLIFSLYAQSKVKRAYKAYEQVPNSRGMTGYQLAEDLKQKYGMDYLGVEVVQGQLTDHYDPRKKKLGLSAEVANKASIASLAIVAHEMGHARQDAEKSVLLHFRDAIATPLNFVSWLSIPLLFIGILFSWQWLAVAGLILYAVIAIFQIVTVPMEVNASKRGLKLLSEGNYLTEGELGGAKKVLSAAALTYVAAMAAVLVNLLRFVLIIFGGRRS